MELIFKYKKIMEIVLYNTIIAVFIFIPTPLLADKNSASTDDNIPLSLTCTSNAQAIRSYGFPEKAWIREIGKTSDEFSTGTKATPRGLIFRDKVFSQLDTGNPIIRSITPTHKLSEIELEEQAVEFVGTILSRAFDSVFITWRNPTGNKVWLAVIDLTHRKAIVSYFAQGITSLEGEIETLDCR